MSRKINELHLEINKNFRYYNISIEKTKKEIKDEIGQNIFKIFNIIIDEGYKKGENDKVLSDIKSKVERILNIEYDDIVTVYAAACKLTNEEIDRLLPKKSKLSLIIKKINKEAKGFAMDSIIGTRSIKGAQRHVIYELIRNVLAGVSVGSIIRHMF